MNFVRLACVRHAASVRPEPGSNSLKIVFYAFALKSFLELNRSFTILAIVIFSLFRFRNLDLVRTFVLKFLSRFLFFRCLIFKVRIAPKSCSISSPAFLSRERSYIIPNHSTFVNTFFKLFSTSPTRPRVYHYTYTFYSLTHFILWFFTIHPSCFCSYCIKEQLPFFKKAVLCC